MTAPAAARAPSGTSAAARIAAISGLAFAVLFVVALVLLHRAPRLGDPDAAYAAFYAGGGDQLFVAVGLYLVPFAGIAFLWHMTAMRNVLDTLTPTPSTMAHGLNLLAGVIFVTLLFAGTAAVGAVAFGVYFGHAPVEDPATARALTAVGYGLVFVFAVRGAGMFAITTTTLLRKAPRARGCAAAGQHVRHQAGHTDSGPHEARARVGAHLQAEHAHGASLRRVRPGDGGRAVRRHPLRQARGAQPTGAPQDPRERGAVHRRHRRSTVEVRARHPAAQLQHLGDEGLSRSDDRYCRAAVSEMGAAESGRADRRHRGHDPADPRHDRAVRGSATGSTRSTATPSTPSLRR
jgi:hypothetical protein